MQRTVKKRMTRSWGARGVSEGVVHMRVGGVLCSIFVAGCLFSAAGCGTKASSPGPSPRQEVSAGAGAETTVADEARPLEPVDSVSASRRQEPTGSQPSEAAPGDPVAAAVEWLAAEIDQPASKMGGRIVATTRDRDEFWVRVSVSHSDPGWETEKVFLSRKTDGGEWKVRYSGTGSEPEDLVAICGVSPEAAQDLFPR